MEILNTATQRFSESRVGTFYRQYQVLILCSVLALFLGSSWLGNVLLIESASRYYNSVYDIIFTVLRYASYAAMAVCILFSLGLKQYRFWPFIVYALTIVLVFFFCRSTEFMILMLVVGSMAVLPRQTLFQVVLIIQAGALTIIPLFAALGLFPNVIMDTERIRYSLGFTWVTSAPVLFVFASMLFLHLERRRLNGWMFFLLLQVATALFILTDTKMAFFTALLVLTIGLIWWKKPQWLQVLENRWVREVILWLPVVLTVIALLLAVFYQDTGVMAKVNDILSGRLANAAEAWQKYGLSLLGQPITWTGQGITYKPSMHYLYVDCSYLNILLNYGLIFLLLVLYWCRKVILNLYHRHDMLYLAFFVVIILFSFLEVRLINPLYDPFVVAAGSYLGLAARRKETA
ncbi:hypothetical protein [uncultured Faecalibaculum sp.]|uniref:hypothetical protein n=2 Tax=uncultured Faecalibaculum sp. TaxID=1729681 RepID=UPI0027120308|nr:hypothetical protein [uncultured Faecalibaculum sp.]